MNPRELYGRVIKYFKGRPSRPNILKPDFIRPRDSSPGIEDIPFVKDTIHKPGYLVIDFEQFTSGDQLYTFLRQFLDKYPEHSLCVDLGPNKSLPSSFIAALLKANTRHRDTREEPLSLIADPTLIFDWHNMGIDLDQICQTYSNAAEFQLPNRDYTRPSA